MASKRDKPDKFDRMAGRMLRKSNFPKCPYGGCPKCIRNVATALRRVDRAAYKRGAKMGIQYGRLVGTVPAAPGTSLWNRNRGA